MDLKEMPVCIVEDNKSNRKLFCIMLNKGGMKTVDFGSGTEAITWIKNNQAVAIILDILLPDMNGTEILKEIRNLPEGDKVPVIAITGFAQSNDRDKFLSQGFDDYIPKPVNTSTFVEQIVEIINIKNK